MEELPPECVELKVERICECGFIYAFETLKKNVVRKRLLIMEQKLAHTVQNNQSISCHIEEKEYVAALVSGWGRYCRGLVTNVTQGSNGNKYTVFLIDYGNYATLNANGLHKLPQNFGVRVLREQARKIALYGVLPLHIEFEFGGPFKTKAGELWNGKDIQFIKNKIKTTDVIHFKEVKKMGGFKFGIIYLKDKSNENQLITLQQLLINQNYATKCDDFERFIPSIVKRFLQSPENVEFFCDDEDSECTSISISDTSSNNEGTISLDTDKSYNNHSSSSNLTEPPKNEFPNISSPPDNPQIPSSSQKAPPKRGISRGQFLKNLVQTLPTTKASLDKPPSVNRTAEILEENQFDDAKSEATFYKVTPLVKELLLNTPSPKANPANETLLSTPPPESNRSTNVVSLVTPPPAISSPTTLSPNTSTGRGRGRGRGVIALMGKSSNASNQGSRKSSFDAFTESRVTGSANASSLSKDIIALSSSFEASSISVEKLSKKNESVNRVIETVDLTSSRDSDVELISVTRATATKSSDGKVAETDPEVVRRNALKSMEAEQVAADESLIDKIMVIRRKRGCDFKPIFKMFDQDLHVELRERLQQLRIRDTTRCQQYMIPAMLTRKHVTLIDAPKNGKTLSAVISVISMLKDEEFYKSLPSGPGPKAIILCPYSSRCEWIYTQCADLVKRGYDSTAFTPHLRINVAYGCGKDLERDKLDELTKGYDIVICTPPCLLRLLEIPEMFNFKRLCHLVLDEAHLLLDSYFEETREIMERAYAVGKKTDTGLILPQRVIISNLWLPKIKQTVQNDVSNGQGIVLLSSYLEAAVFCNLKTSLKFFNDQKKKMNDVLDHLIENTARKNVVVVFNDEEIPALDEVYYALKKTRRRIFRVTRAHPMIHELISSWLEASRNDSFPILLCTDQTHHDIPIYEANCLIHYSLPKIRGFFSRRFMFLLKCLNIPREFLDEETPKTDFKPETLIYLGLDDYEQFPTIIDLMERLRAFVPKEIKTIANKLKVMREQRKGDVALCNNLKKFARCVDESSCEYRHNFSLMKDQPDPDIPLSGLVKIHILRVHSATHFSVRLLEQKVGSDKWTKVKNISHPHVINTKLKEYLDNSDNRALHQCEAVGEVVGIETSPKIYKRAKVLKLIKNEEGKIRRVMVKFMEDGGVEEVRPTVLLKLPQELAEKRASAVDVFLGNLLPVDRDIEWGERITLTVRDRINELLEDSSNFFVGKIHLVAGRDIWLSLLECKQWFTSINEFTTVYSVYRELLREKKAVVNEEHLTKLATMYKWAGFDICEESSGHESSIHLSPLPNPTRGPLLESNVEQQDSMVDDVKQQDSVDDDVEQQDSVGDDLEQQDSVEDDVKRQDSVEDDVEQKNPVDDDVEQKDAVDETVHCEKKPDGPSSSVDDSLESENSDGETTISKYQDLAMQVTDDSTFDVNFTEDELKEMIKSIMPGILPESSTSDSEDPAPPVVIIKPIIDWHQDLTYVYVTIYLNTDDYDIRFATNNIYFRANFNDKVYEFDEKLYASISEITSTHRKSGVTIVVKMEKLIKRNKWTRLLKRKDAQHWVKVNKEFLDDEDEDGNVSDEYWSEELYKAPAYVENIPNNTLPLVGRDIGIRPEGYEDYEHSDDSDAYGDRAEEYCD